LRPHSATLILVTDGDTVPATGMPKMPVAIEHKLIIGVGDTQKGTFIDGRHSRQEASTLRQIAIRLGGVYHDGNEKHVGSDILATMTRTGETSAIEKLTRREYALLASILGATILALLPLGLQHFGTRWSPGVVSRRLGAEPSAATRPVRDSATTVRSHV